MRGTTPHLTFTLPFEASMVAKAKLVIKQGDRLLLRKNTADCTLEDNTLTARLSREDTLQLPEDETVFVQLEIETTGGDSLVAAPVTLYTGRLLDEEVLL